MSWINIFGIIIIVLMMVPNIVFAIKNKDAQNKCTNRAMNILEQIGRYGTMLLMIVNIGATNNGFVSDGAFAVWLVLSAVLMLAYWICWIIFYRKVSKTVMLLLAIFPGMIFIISGICREYWLLLVFSVLFTVSHIYVTYKNTEN